MENIQASGSMGTELADSGMTPKQERLNQSKCGAGAEGKLRHNAVFRKSGHGLWRCAGAHSLLCGSDKHAGLGLNGVSVCLQGCSFLDTITDRTGIPLEYRRLLPFG